MTRILLALALAAWAGSAGAAPPEPGSDDAHQMAPYRDWITNQHARNGNWCCDGSDGRPTDYDIRPGQDKQDHWFAHITPDHFPTLPDEWIEIPDYLIRKPVPGDNSPPFAMIWMNTAHNAPYCFHPGSGM